MAVNYTGTKWGDGAFGTSGGTVTWSFSALAGRFYDFDRMMTETVYQVAVQAAFDAWEAVADIDFVRLADGVTSQIGLAWDAIDGRYGTVGEASWAYYTVSQTTAHSEIRFDTAEVWRVGSEGLPGAIDFLSVAVHEIGHAIGLGHSADADSIMHAYVHGHFEGLDTADIAAIQALYGAAQPETVSAAPVPSPPSSPPVLMGTDGADDLFGSDAGETLRGFFGRDTIRGGGGNDVIFGNQDEDTLYGDDGADTLYGGKDSDVLRGGTGTDDLFGNLGDDTLFGNENADYLHGGKGNDVLFGGKDDDRLNGGAGDDILAGNLGADTFIFWAAQGTDRIVDFDYYEGDRLDLSGQGYRMEADAASGDLLLFLSGGGTVILEGVDEATFSSDFLV